MLSVTNAALATYDLRSSIGPLSGAASFDSGVAFAATTGLFILNSVSGDATFQAVVSTSAVPEPSSLPLCGVAGLSGLVVVRLRRRPAA
jgi:hypothetical protein